MSNVTRLRPISLDDACTLRQIASIIDMANVHVGSGSFTGAGICIANARAIAGTIEDRGEREQAHKRITRLHDDVMRAERELRGKP